MKEHIINVSPIKAFYILVLLDDYLLIDSLKGIDVGDIIKFRFDDDDFLDGVYQITSFETWFGNHVIRFKRVGL